MKKYLSLVAIFLVFGCAKTITSKVTTFNDNIAPSGKLYYIEPTSEQKRNLAFKTYSSYVVDALAKHNYDRVSSPEKANYIANISYGVNNPVGYVGGDSEHVDTNIEYTSFFKIDFVDKKTKEPIYSSEAKATTNKNNFINTSKCVINAAFIDFPNSNQSIKTRKVTDCYFKSDEDKNLFDRLMKN